MKPLAIDLFCGLGGWTEALLAEGWDVVGFDVERHRYMMPDLAADDSGSKHTKPVAKRGWTQGCAITLGMEGAGSKPRTKMSEYAGQLVLQDVLTLHGSQLRNASLIVASPPCQAYSYRAMPWKRAKALPHPSNELFEACFRIQREASEAAGRYIPLIVENVKGAQPWVGRAKWHYGSFYLWGDVPALMPFAKQSAALEGLKWGDCNGKRFDQRPKGNVAAHREGTRVPSSSGRRTDTGNGVRFTTRDCGIEGNKGFAKRFEDTPMAQHSSKSNARKAASAQIAKIPLPLAQHIARTFKP